MESATNAEPYSNGLQVRLGRKATLARIVTAWVFYTLEQFDSRSSLMDMIQLYIDNHIQHWTSGKNVATGWVNIRCPFCPNDSNHLGWHLSKEYYNCWKCGPKPTKMVLGRILRLDENQVSAILRNYGYRKHTTAQEEVKLDLKKRPHVLPFGTGPLQAQHKRYLARRKFDPDRLEAEWGLLGTGPISILSTGEKTIDFKHRIIAPIRWGGQQVSYQARDITNQHQIRYITCPRDREIIFHKHILYGNQDKWEEFAIVVEGITDVWRLGPIAVATFGIEFTTVQVHTLAANFSRLAVMYDDEPQAVRQAEKLVAELRFRGIDSWRVPIVGDPGGMPQPEADNLVLEMISKASK